MSSHARGSGVTFIALKVCHGDKVCPRHAAVRAVLDVAVRHAQAHASAHQRHLIDGRNKRVLCLRRQVVKVANLGAQPVKARVLRRRVDVV